MKQKPFYVIKNEKGVALITVMMLMVILLIIGMAATDTTIMERNIAENEVAYRRGFYKADSGISYAQTILKDDAADYNAGDVISAGDEYYKLRVVRAPYSLQAGPGSNWRWTVRSEPSDASILAGDSPVQVEVEIEFASAQEGMIQGPGNETDYAL